MKKSKEKLTYKLWKDLTVEQKLVAEERFVKGQVPTECQYGYNNKNKLIRILDFGVLKDVFSI